MITVKLVGGARKSFPTGQLQIDGSDMTIRDLIGMLRELKPDGLPELDTRNVLIAVNGIDSSAMEGRLSRVKDGDIVSIIPIIHGGSGDDSGGGGAGDGARRPEMLVFKARRRVQVARVSGRKAVGRGFLDDLRARHPRVRLQAVSARFVASAAHMQKILYLSLKAERDGVLLSKRLETDILMRFTLTGQISEAIAAAGIRPGADFMLVAVGDKRAADALYRELRPVLADGLIPERSAAPFLRRRFKITKRHLDAVRSDSPLEDILAERAAVLLV